MWNTADTRRTSLLSGSVAGSFSAQERDALMSVNGGLNYGAVSTSTNERKEERLWENSDVLALDGESVHRDITRNDLVFNEKDLGLVQEDIHAAHERQGRRSQGQSRSATGGSFDEHLVVGMEDDEQFSQEAAAEQEEASSSSCIGRFIWNLAWPLRMLFMVTCPNCEEGSKYAWMYPLTFVVSFVWVGD